MPGINYRESFAVEELGPTAMFEATLGCAPRYLYKTLGSQRPISGNT